LEALFETEFPVASKGKSGYPPFLSQTTMGALRISILSSIELTNELFQNSYKYILSGKWNQDCIEVNIKTTFKKLTH
jgi:hypothetical protein